MSKLYDTLTKTIMESSISEEEKQSLLKAILRNKEQKVNVLITGATGCGKSSTINALFNAEKAKVGTSPNPETMSIEYYELDNLILWDSPGLGDGLEQDKVHSEGIKALLEKKDEDGNLLIDLVLVILDGRSRDMGTSYELITKVIVPVLGDTKRLIVGINQVDAAMGNRHWNFETHQPDKILLDYIKEKEKSVHDRILDGTGISVQPVSYVAGYKEEGLPQEPAYNLSKLLYYIMENVPAEKRLNVVEQLNERKEMWESDDKQENYHAEIQRSASEGVVSSLKNASLGAAAGAALGAAIGSVIPGVGTAIGTAVGTVAGAVFSVAADIISGIRSILPW